MIIKGARVILNDSTVGPASVIESFVSYEKFVGVLGAGTSATVLIEQSMDAANGWSELCTFTLDTQHEEIDTDLMRVTMPFVRATLVAIAGSVPRVIVYMGA